MQQTGKYNKKEAESQRQNKPVVTSVGGGKRSDMVRGVETTGFKTGSRIYCTTQGI